MTSTRDGFGHGRAPDPPAEEKLAELVLLMTEALADDPYGGATKLNKALFFADFGHMRSTGRPITGVAYQRLAHGPAPRRLRPVRERLIRNGSAELLAETVHSFDRHRLRALRPARRELFTSSELAAIADAVATVRARTSAEVTALSHQHPGYQLVGDGEDIPYAAALLVEAPRTVSGAIRDRAARLAEEHAARLHRPT